MTNTSLTSTTGAQFNPAITSKEVIDIREANLGFEATVSRNYYDEAKVGTTIKWVSIAGITASTKSEGNSNTIAYTANTESATTLTINAWKYAAIELEEFENSLSIVDQQAIYTRRCVYACNLAIDTTLAALPGGASQNVGTLAIDNNDDDIRRAVQYLDDANAPQDERFLAMSPATKNAFLAIDRYASSDFAKNPGGADVIKGQVGEVYALTAWNSTNLNGTNAAGHDNAIYQRDFLALGMRMEPRTRTFDNINDLSTQVAVSTIYGAIRVRADHGVYVKGS